jgi:type II secretory pathway component PulK
MRASRQFGSPAPMGGREQNAGRPGYVLIVVLLVIVVLSLAAYRFAEAMTAEYAVAVRSTEAVQAKAFAVSGVYYAAGALADPATMTDTLANNPTDAASFGNVAVGGGSGPRGGGKFSLYTVGDTFTGTGEGRYAPRFGVTDEGGKLNVNALIAADDTGDVLHDALMKLPNMTEEIADAIVDWLDADDEEREAGAEAGYYGGLPGAYRTKNGPASTLDELLLVRGVTAQLLYGTDRNRNGKMDAAEADGGDFSRGWSEFLTVYGRELDVDADGAPRISLADTAADPNTLYSDLVAAVGQDPADYILFVMFGGTTASIAPPPAPAEGSTESTGTTASTSTGSSSGSGGGSSSTMSSTTSSSSGGSASSGNTATATPVATTGSMADINAYVQQKLMSGAALSKPVESVLTLVDSVATVPKTTMGANGQSSSTNVTVASPLNDVNNRNTLLPTILEATTPRTDYDMPPRINVNTAPPEVLTALPGLTAEEVTAITTARDSLAADDPARGTGIWLVTAGNLSPAKFQAIEPYVTGRSMTYRVQSVGFFANGGPAARVEAVIDTNLGHPRVLYFRDLTDLGRGFEIAR